MSSLQRDIATALISIQQPQTDGYILVTCQWHNPLFTACTLCTTYVCVLSILEVTEYEDFKQHGLRHDYDW